jgi:hypothetical protein
MLNLLIGVASFRRPVIIFVRKDRTRLTVHLGVVQNLSEFMNDLVNSGQVKENGSWFTDRRGR